LTPARIRGILLVLCGLGVTGVVAVPEIAGYTSATVAEVQAELDRLSNARPADSIRSNHAAYFVTPAAKAAQATQLAKAVCRPYLHDAGVAVIDQARYDECTAAEEKSFDFMRYCNNADGSVHSFGAIGHWTPSEKTRIDALVTPLGKIDPYNRAAYEAGLVIQQIYRCLADGGPL
jgi:hypothetical protein